MNIPLIVGGVGVGIISQNNVYLYFDSNNKQKDNIKFSNKIMHYLFEEGFLTGNQGIKVTKIIVEKGNIG
jgi:hypothetical protein